MRELKNVEKGITLVALVITIIILLILAGISISALSGDNGLLKRAMEARDETGKAINEENKTLEDIDSFLKYNLADNVEDGLVYKTDKKLDFYNEDDYIEVADKNTDYSKGLTMEIYFETKGKGKNGIQSLIVKRTNADNGYFFYIDSANKVAIDVGGGGTERYYSGYTVQDNNKTYLTYTFDPSTNEGKLYEKGIEIKTTNKGNIEKVVSTQNQCNILLGGNKNTYPLNGSIYIARIYNRPLTSDEVKYNYEKTVENE